MAVNTAQHTEVSPPGVSHLGGDTPQVTRELARWIAASRHEAMTPLALEWARHCLLDWFAVTIAGRDEPLAAMLIDEYVLPGGGPATVIATGARARVHDAALINGSLGHALDFDDVNTRMGGHPTVPVAPVVLALGESKDITGHDLLRAFIVGYQVECELGDMCIPSHYQKGFHATGTLGTFGAAAAAAFILRLDENASANALGMAATQASGLKSMFGTMTKPLHAGKAAMNGLMAAQLAARGFTANDTGIECEQGFAATQVPDFAPRAGAVDTSQGYAVQTNLFKYHAACYLTHSAIEAIRRIRQAHSVGLDDLQSMAIRVPETHKKVCDIREPITGLNIKFSIRHLAAMALDGQDTADLAMYSDENANDARFVTARRQVELVPSDPSTTTADIGRAAQVTIQTKDGQTLESEFNVAIPDSDIKGQWQRLTEKAQAIVAPVLGVSQSTALIEAIDGLDSATDLGRLLQAATKT